MQEMRKAMFRALVRFIRAFDYDHGLPAHGDNDTLEAVQIMCNGLGLDDTWQVFMLNIELQEGAAFFEDQDALLNVLSKAKQEFEALYPDVELN